MVSYLCHTLGAMAREMGLDVPEWRDDYLIDYHALALLREAETEG